VTALIIVDLLEDFFDPAIWPESAIPPARARLAKRTNELAVSCRAAGIPVIWFRQEFRADLQDAFLHMRRNDRHYTIVGTKGCQLLAELEVGPEDRVLLKTRFSAFYRTELEAVLEKLGSREVIIAGITTAWCVRSTVVDAFQRDMEVIVATDCVAAFTEEAHESSIAAMNGYVARCLSNEAIVRRIT